ncbi:DNA-processing protein DprA [Streptomyces sp. NPDC058947]|uniref:DNA-processing protein DprA n=1 Tax=Streptomyces sp. NPDC058947 TaxID=3346675 RepID=UPI003693F8F1
MPAVRMPSERSALAAHVAPEQVAADLAAHSAAEVWQQRVRADTSGRLARYRPDQELDRALFTCQFVIPSDEGWPTALAVLGERRPLGLWVLGRDRLPQLTASTVAVTGNRNAIAQALSEARDYARALAGAGHTVTATLAFGVDAAAPNIGGRDRPRRPEHGDGPRPEHGRGRPDNRDHLGTPPRRPTYPDLRNRSPGTWAAQQPTTTPVTAQTRLTLSPVSGAGQAAALGICTAAPIHCGDTGRPGLNGTLELYARSMLSSDCDG